MGTVFTPSQQQVIDHRQGGLLVSAAAGSGKTTVMVEQIVGMLMDPEHEVSVDQLLVVTFTAAAADSMKRKLEERLAQELEKDESNEWLAEQIHLVPLSSVTTNHSFSLQLVKDYITRIDDIDPGFRVAEEAETALLRTDVLQQVLEQFYSEALNDRESEQSLEFLSFVNAYGGARQDDKLEDLILRVYNKMMSDPDPMAWLDKAVETLDPDFSGPGSLYELGELAKDDEDRKEQIRHYLLPAMKGLRRVIRSFDREYHKEKSGRNILEFNDFEHFSLKVLEDIAVCESVRERYKYIFIDEYQDCNRLQEAIINRIAEHNDQGTATNVFMVGDVKQSIYRFRLADPSMFTEKYGVYGKIPDTTLISLNQNFRSGTEVIDSVNDIFYALMRPEAGGISYGEKERLNPAPFRLEQEREGFTTKLIVNEMSSAPKQVIAEAKLIGQEIQRLTKEQGFQFGDMVILLRSMSRNGAVYFEELQKMGIPVNYESSESFYDTIEVRTILNLLSVIDNPHQDIPLLGVLYSPIGDLDEEDLGRIRIARRDSDFFDALKAYAELGNEDDTLLKVQTFLSRLEGWREMASRKVIHDLVWKLYLDTGYYLYVSAMTEGSLRKANLDLLLRRSIEFEKGSYSGLYQFLRYVEKMDKSTTIEKDAGGRASGNAVRIMTIHKSKGLEFPVVFCANLGKEFNKSDVKAPVVLHDKMGIGANMVDPKRHVKMGDVKKKAIGEVIVNELLAEEIRLLYVAMTRAKERLIMVGSRSKEAPELSMDEDGRLSIESILGAKSYLQWIEGILNAKKTDSFDIQIVSEEPEGKEDTIEADAEAGVGSDSEVNAGGRVSALEETVTETKPSEVSTDLNWEKLSWTYTHKWRAKVPKVISVSAVKHARMEETKEALADEEQQVVQASFAKSTDAPASPGALRGTAYHEIMARGDFRNLGSSESMEEEIGKIVNDGYLTREEADLVPEDWVLQFGNSRLCQRVIASDHVVKERPFVLKLSLKELKELASSFDFGGDPDTMDEEDAVILQGIIDLYFTEGDEIILADYKTDYLLDEAAVAGYSVQLSIYQKALEAATGKKVREKMLYDVRRGKEILC